MVPIYLLLGGLVRVLCHGQSTRNKAIIQAMDFLWVRGTRFPAGSSMAARWFTDTWGRKA